METFSDLKLFIANVLAGKFDNTLFRKALIEMNKLIVTHEIKEPPSAENQYEYKVNSAYVLAVEGLLSLMKFAAEKSFAALDGNFYIAGMDLSFKNMRDYIEKCIECFDLSDRYSREMLLLIYEKYLQDCEDMRVSYIFDCVEAYTYQEGENIFPFIGFDEAMEAQNDVQNMLTAVWGELEELQNNKFLDEMLDPEFETVN